MFFRNGRLLVFHAVGSSHRFLSLIVVPARLRHTVFFAYHTGAAGAHMGKTKTLLVLRMRFFWPQMRKDILQWVNACTSCIAAQAGRREQSGLVHSWPVTTPFAIVSVDIWLPGSVSNADGYSCLLNAMCDMTQFVVVQGAKSTESSYLARLFMEGFLLKFGLCLLVVIDADSSFRGTFEKMCKALNLRFHVVAKRNHKAVGVERFHKFLNHATTIAAEERGSAAIFVECAIATAYAWNSSPIDSTDVVRSLPAIGRELRFPLDIDLSDPPPMVDNPGKSIASYL